MTIQPLTVKTLTHHFLQVHDAYNPTNVEENTLYKLYKVLFRINTSKQATALFIADTYDVLSLYAELEPQIKAKAHIYSAPILMFCLEMYHKLAFTGDCDFLLQHLELDIYGFQAGLKRLSKQELDEQICDQNVMTYIMDNYTAERVYTFIRALVQLMVPIAVMCLNAMPNVQKTAQQNSLYNQDDIDRIFSYCSKTLDQGHRTKTEVLTFTF